jgi:transcriptional regulator with GAF, ATPase, and Fis domain
MFGPQIFALQGYGWIDTVALELDLEAGHNYGEFFWRNSPEADAHIAAFGYGTAPACWMEIGYASGYGSAFMGKRILVREVECRAMGHPHCRSIAKPVEKWEDPERDLKYFMARAPERQQARAPGEHEAQTKSSKSGAESVADRSGEAPIGASVAFITTMHKIHRVAPTRATVLLLGESGVGKSMLAREVHINSTRADRPFVEVNCATIPEQLIEAELFGVERGAYTGATATRPGRFEVADGGTLFLDEIALLTPTAQGKLLRVLQTGEMEHLGSARTQKVDVRLVTATNVNLTTAIREGRFREDLFYRINVFPILVPPLRERLDDIPVLLEQCLKKFASRHNRNVVGVTKAALEAIFAYDWPGNIREFENVIERGLILADDGNPIDVGHLVALGDASRPETTSAFKADTTEWGEQRSAHPERADITGWAHTMLANRITIADVEDALIQAAVKQADGNVSKAASLLGVPRGRLDYRLKKWGQVQRG